MTTEAKREARVPVVSDEPELLQRADGIELREAPPEPPLPPVPPSPDRAPVLQHPGTLPHVVHILSQQGWRVSVPMISDLVRARRVENLDSLPAYWEAEDIDKLKVALRVLQGEPPVRSGAVPRHLREQPTRAELAVERERTAAAEEEALIARREALARAELEKRHLEATKQNVRETIFAGVDAVQRARDQGQRVTYKIVRGLKFAELPVTNANIALARSAMSADGAVGPGLEAVEHAAREEVRHREPE